MDPITQTDTLSYSSGAPLPEADLQNTFWKRFEDNSVDYASQTALVCLHQPHNLFSSSEISTEADETLPLESKSPYLRWTYRKLHQVVDRLTKGLQTTCNVTPGMIFVTFLPNRAEYVVARLAAQLMGCTFAPLNPKQLVSKAEIEHLLGLFLEVAAVKKLVVFAAKKDMATFVDTFASLDNATKVVCDDMLDESVVQSSSKWVLFEGLLSSSGIKSQSTVKDTRLELPTDNIILCTSGTTGMPKACLYTSKQISHHMNQIANLKDHRFTSSDIGLVTVPNNHIAGYEALLCSLYFGGTVVFPGPGFDVNDFAQAARLESPTFSILVPTMVASLASAGVKAPSLQIVFLGGATLNADTIRMCKENISIKTTSPVFGSTEGAFLRAGSCAVTPISSNQDICVGAVSLGQYVKICEPLNDNSATLSAKSKLVARGQLGELHISSPGLCDGYIGQSNTAFYIDDEGRNWFNTSDQAYMDQNDQLFVSGRYKDMIIRGGENISPVALEAILDREHQGINAQIVGYPDEVAGEVPVVVSKLNIGPQLAASVRKTLVTAFGLAYAPGGVVSLSQLGLTDYPRTTVGKVYKRKLKELVSNYGQKHDGFSLETPLPDKDFDILHGLKKLWSDVLSIDYDVLSEDTQLTAIADSISMMRMQGKIARVLGITLSLAQLSSASTLGGLAKLIGTMEQQFGNTTTDLVHTTEPPAVDDMVQLTEKPELFETTKSLIEQAISKVGLEWSNVRSVAPAYDMNLLSLRFGVMDRIALRIMLRLKRKSKEKARLAFISVLRNNPMLASFVVTDKDALGPEMALHVTVEQTEHLLNQIIFDGGEIQDIGELKEFSTVKGSPQCRDVFLPGPLLRVTLFEIKDTDDTAVLFHSMNKTHY